jgi:penicillin-binding protein 1C
MVALWLVTPVFLRFVPLPAALFQPSAPGMEIVDRHGTPLRDVHGAEGFTGRIASLQEVPDSLVRATLAAEDKRFWRHHGVDWLASTRAAAAFVRNGRVISGGSTITQQLIKRAEPRPRTLRTKLIEAVQAMRLEQIWSKERILSEYLNRLDYGHCRFGIMAAAGFYFGKPPSDLSDGEAAFLAGIPQSPTRLNPHGHLDRAQKRQRWILAREQAEGWLATDAAKRAASEPIRLQPVRGVFRAPHFVDLLLQGQPPSHQGTIRTTLDLPLNDFAERELEEQLSRLHDRNVLNGAIVVIENLTGNVLALVGSGDYYAPDAGQVNGAWAPRSAGSTFKPFTYLLALERGATPASIVADVPVEFPTSTGVFAPLNYDRRCHGPMRYRPALANSLNIPAVRVLDSVGGPAVLRERLERCGLTTLKQPPEYYGLGLTIGNAEARLLELANAYASIARLGRFEPLHFTTDAFNSNDPPAPEPSAPPAKESKSPRGGPAPDDRHVFDAGACHLIADILSDNAARALEFGLNSSLRFDFPVACKTGTSSDFRDNWAFGFTPEFTVGVWIGNFDGSPMRDVSGVSGAAPVLHALFEQLHARFSTSWFATPTNIVEHWVHPVTGKLLAAERPGAIREKFLAGHLPPAESPDDYDGQGRVRLPLEYGEWLAGGQNWLGDRAVLDHRADTAGTRLSIVSPQPGTTYYLDPDLPNQGAILRLRAHGPTEVRWRSETLPIETRNDGAFAIMTVGRHEIIARDEASGHEARTWIVVERL